MKDLKNLKKKNLFPSIVCPNPLIWIFKIIFSKILFNFSVNSILFLKLFGFNSFWKIQF